MSNGMNKVMMIGGLCDNAELRMTQAGSGVLNFRVACTETWIDKDQQKQERTEYITCAMFGKRAESIAQYMTKGTTVYCEGKMRTRSYDDKDGKKVWKTEVAIDDVKLLGGGKRGDGADGGGGTAGGQHAYNASTSRASGGGGGYGSARGSADGGGARPQQRPSGAQPPPADDYGGGGSGGGTDDELPFASCDVMHDPMFARCGI